jgi:hypothetical protein
MAPVDSRLRGPIDCYRAAMLATRGMTKYRRGMTRKIAISVPDDVAARLEREPNVSAFVAESVRIRMAAESVREAMTAAGFALTPQGRASAAAELDALHAGVTPELRREAAELKSQLRRGRAG